MHDSGCAESLADRLRTLGQEQPLLGASDATSEPARRLDPAAARGQRLNGLDETLAQAESGALTSSGRAARAVSTRTVKAGASLTARSARILRSTSTPAILRPWMKRL
jgi:hypothetical protein